LDLNVCEIHFNQEENMAPPKKPTPKPKPAPPPISNCLTDTLKKAEIDSKTFNVTIHAVVTLTYPGIAASLFEARVSTSPKGVAVVTSPYLTNIKTDDSGAGALPNILTYQQVLTGAAKLGTRDRFVGGFSGVVRGAIPIGLMAIFGRSAEEYFNYSLLLSVIESEVFLTVESVESLYTRDFKAGREISFVPTAGVMDGSSCQFFSPDKSVQVELGLYQLATKT
jgi:hypothetical protein